MQKKILIGTLVLCSILLFIGLFPIHGEAQIYDSVVRLHVLANSDSEEDQALKLAVRDAVLEITAPLLQGCTERERAIALLEESMPRIQEVAEKVIAQAGKDDRVRLELGLEDYPQKNYQSFCFPAGEYLSLRVCIGEAEGQNWWCCLFPPLCLGSATVSKQDAEDACISVGLTPTQYKIITETEEPVYKVRFKLLELIQSWFR